MVDLWRFISYRLWGREQRVWMCTCHLAWECHVPSYISLVCKLLVCATQNLFTEFLRKCCIAIHNDILIKHCIWPNFGVYSVLVTCADCFVSIIVHFASRAQIFAHHQISSKSITRTTPNTLYTLISDLPLAAAATTRLCLNNARLSGYGVHVS